MPAINNQTTTYESVRGHGSGIKTPGQQMMSAINMGSGMGREA